MAPAALLTRLLGRRAATIVMLILKDVAITAALTLISRILWLASNKLNNMKDYRYYYKTKPEDDYVTVRTRLDYGRGRIKKKRTTVPGDESEEER